MTDFKIGDVVRLKKDGITKLPLVIRSIKDSFCLCVSECGSFTSWQADYSLELVHRPDPQADIKQAIRKVLLGDEFMKAFAAAWMKTPLPIAMPCDDKDGERIKSLADYPFCEPSEGLAIAPITGSESEAYYLDKLKKGEAK